MSYSCVFWVLTASFYPLPSKRSIVSSSLNRGRNPVSPDRLPRKLAALLYVDLAD